jgi:hypothetical protein
VTTTLSQTCINEHRREDDTKWPQKNKDGRQELEIKLGGEHISFETAKIGSLQDVQDSSDPEGLRVFYYLVQDLKALVFSLISLHFKVPLLSTPSRQFCSPTCRSSRFKCHAAMRQGKDGFVGYV